MRNVYIAISQGNVYRDLVRLGMLRHLLDTVPDIRVILLTQAYAVPEVLDEVRHERVLVARHDMFAIGRWGAYAVMLRQRQKHRVAIDLLLRVESALAPEPPGLARLFHAYPPALVVTTHPQVLWEWDGVGYARRRRVPTAGIIKSWDNVLGHPQARADQIATWGRANYREAMEVERYREAEVRMVGAAPLDRYFTPGVLQPRDAFWRSKGLDPAKPIVLFGTAGAFSGDWDETFMMDLLLEMRRQTPELRDVQIVCRLHPITHLEYFWQYRDRPGVILSFGSYVKTLGWCMTRDEVDDMANLLCHSDLVITPASTLSLEGPVFDTPTIATLFSTVRPDLHERATQAGWLDRHFKPIVANDWLPLARTPEELKGMMLRALADRSWYREGRKALVEEYVTFTDGKSLERVAAFIDDLANGRPAGSTKRSA